MVKFIRNIAIISTLILTNTITMGNTTSPTPTMDLIDFDDQNMELLETYGEYTNNEYWNLMALNGIDIKIVDQIDNGTISGLYTGDMIYIADGYIPKSLNHEIGHFIDDYYNYTNTNEFRAIYECEKGYMNREYIQDDIEEYFAGCYQAYVEEWPVLDNMPLTKQFFEENVKKGTVTSSLTYL